MSTPVTPFANIDAVAPTQQGVGKATVEVPVPAKVSAPIQGVSLTAAVNAASAPKAPKGLSGFNTKDLSVGYFHAMLYSETGAYKTTTAANFGGPEKTLIILTRNEEQMRPLQNQGFRIVKVEDGEALSWAMQFPEKAAAAIGWPEWATLEDRVLVVDDMTEGADMLVDEERVNDKGEEVKDGRKLYGNTNANFREVLASLKRKKLHVIYTALADVKNDNLDNEEVIFPKVPKGIRQMLTADVEFVFFLKKDSKKFLTNSAFINITKKDEKTGKPVMAKREIFGKSKVAKELAGGAGSILALEEPIGEANGTGLRTLWEKVRAAQVRK